MKDGDTTVLLDPVTLEKAAASSDSRPSRGRRGTTRGRGSPTRRKLEYELQPRREARGVRPEGQGDATVSENLFVEDAAGGNEWQVTQGAKPGRALRKPRLGLPGGGLRPRQLQGILVEPRLEVDRVSSASTRRTSRTSRSSITSRPRSTRTRRSRSRRRSTRRPATRTRRSRSASRTSRAGRRRRWTSRATSPTSSSRASPGIRPARCSSQIQNRIQSWLDVVRIDPATGKLTKLFREESTAWVDVIGAARVAEGRIVPLAQRPDRLPARLPLRRGREARARADRRATGPCATSDWVDEAGGWIYFTATKDGAVGNNLYRAPLKGGDVEAADRGPRARTRSRGAPTTRSSSIRFRASRAPPSSVS